MTSDALTSAAADVFAQLGGEMVDPPTLMDAAIPLDLSGEAVRTRLCVFSDARGREIALRPDLTLPVALEESCDRTGGVTGERVRRYVARAFRLPVADGFDTEFTQVGFERFGAPSGVASDVGTFAAVLEAASVGQPDLEAAWLGDLAIYPAIVDAILGETANASAVKRRFRQGGSINPEGATPHSGNGSRKLAAMLSQTSREDAEGLVREMLAMSGVEPVGARGLDEIVDRLMSQADAEGAGSISDAEQALLEEILALTGPVRKTADALAKTVRTAKLEGMDGVLDALMQRLDALEKAAGTVPLFFAVSFGRRFNYYDGFLFEIFARDAHPLAPLAAGGRYDALVRSLSDGKADTTAIGGVVRPDRMALAPTASGSRRKGGRR